MKTVILLITAGFVILGIAVANTNFLETQPQARTILVTKPTQQVKLAVQPHTPKRYELKLSSRVVYVQGVIEDNADSIAKQILVLGQSPEPIIILINSPGGSVFDGAEIVAAMESAKGPVITVCTQICASMAFIIHQYGTDRLMINHSVLMAHPASAGAQGEVDKMNSRITFLKRYVDKMNQKIAARSGLSEEQFKSEWEVEHWVDAEDATNEGLNDAVVFVRGIDALKLYPETLPAMLKNELLKSYQWR